MNSDSIVVSDSYLQVDNSSEPDKNSISKHARNGSLKPLNETPPIKPIINNSISTSLLRPKEKKVSLTQKKLRFSLNFEIGETPNRQFNDSTTSEVFSSEHADESDLFLPLDTSNSESQNPDYLPFVDDEIEDPKQPIDDDTGVHSIDDDDDIESISDEESNPNSELHLDGIDDCEMGSDDSPRRTDPKREPTPPSEDDFDEFLTMLRQDSLQHTS